jgi:hypothetical protein
MKIKNRKLRKFFWEIRRHAIIFAVYAIILFAVIWAICFMLSIPEIIASLFFGF